MKHIEQFRKIAILMDKTHDELWDVCDFINAEHYFYGEKNTGYTDFKQYVNDSTDLSEEQISNLVAASAEMADEDDYSLAKEFGMLSTMIVAMDECNFGEYNPTIYEISNRYCDQLGDEIIMECSGSTDPVEMAKYLEEIMNAGKGDELIYNYMTDHGFHTY